MDVLLRMNLLGGFLLTYEGILVTEINTERLQSLAAYLALHRGTPQSRQHIAFSFWPDSREKQAYNNLRNVLHRLRNALPDAGRFLQIDAKSLCWRDNALMALDVADFEMLLARANEARQRADTNAELAALQAALQLYQGDLLSGLYDDWILPERERLRLTSIEAFERLVQLIELKRDYPTALHHAHRLLQVDPLREPTYRLLMRLHTLNGDRAGALRIYQHCVEILMQELDLEPQPETYELYLRIQNGQDLADSESQSSEASIREIPLVGRHEEWKGMQQSWHTASKGRAQLLTISGEAGIGKTRLVEELHDWVGNQGMAVAMARCYGAEGRLAYASVVEWLRSEQLATNRSALDEIWLVELQRLLPELRATQSVDPPSEPLHESWERRHLFEALARFVLAGGRPLLLILDDLQWCDQDTLEWLRFLLRFAPEAPLLIVGTIRSEELIPRALEDLLLELGRNNQVTNLELSPLMEEETTQLAFHVAGAPLSDSLAAWLYRETEGNPLFVVESVRARQSYPENENRANNAEFSDSPALSLPTRVRAVLARRLSRLTPGARSLVSLAAVIGRSFTVDVLIRASQMMEDAVVDALDELWKNRIIREYANASYDFTHDKLREAAYTELSPVRRRLFHRRIAEVLEELYASNPDVASAQIAVHYEQAHLHEPAIVFYTKAASVAQDLGSHPEAIQHYSRALELLEALPDSRERSEKKQDLLISLGLVLRLTKGHAASAVGEVFEKARLLNEQVGGSIQQFAIQRGLWSFHLLRAEYRIASPLAEDLLRLADRLCDDALRLEALVALGLTSLWQGALGKACDYLEKSLDLYDPPQHGSHVVRYGQDPGVASHSLLAYAKCLLGRWNESKEHLHKALALAEELVHPFSRSYALQHAMLIAHGARRGEEALIHAEDLLRLSEERGYVYWLGPARIGQGWALAEVGQPSRGVRLIEEGLAAHRDRGARLSSTLWRGMLAEAQIRMGRRTEALEQLDSALELTVETGERIWETELMRLKGELLIDRAADLQEAEICFERALETARSQQAKLLELRATASLSRLWHREGNVERARNVLQKACAWFSEGLEERDLIDARRLLDSWK